MRAASTCCASPIRKSLPAEKFTCFHATFFGTYQSWYACTSYMYQGWAWHVGHKQVPVVLLELLNKQVAFFSAPRVLRSPPRVCVTADSGGEGNSQHQEGAVKSEIDHFKRPDRSATCHLLHQSCGAVGGGPQKVRRQRVDFETARNNFCHDFDWFPRTYEVARSPRPCRSSSRETGRKAVCS